MLDQQARRLQRLVHHRDVERAVEQALRQHRAGLGDGGEGKIGPRRLQSGDPRNQQALPQRRFRADREMLVVLARKTHIQLGLLPYAHHRERVFLELFAGRCDLRADFGALEELSTEHHLEVAHARRDSRLRDVHPARGFNETAGFRDHQEGACERDVHGAQRCSSVIIADDVSKRSIDDSEILRLRLRVIAHIR